MRALVLALMVLAGPDGLDVPPIGRVVDLAGVLAVPTEATLTTQLRAHEDSTGNQISVLTVPSLEGEVLEPYATRVFRTWGLGQADRNNGVLLLVAVEDREVRIEVGYGLEGAVTDATAATIIRSDIVPRFREGDFDGGVLAAVGSIIQAAQGEYTAPPDAYGDDMHWTMLLFFAAAPFLLGLSAFKTQGPFGRYVILALTLGMFYTIVTLSGELLGLRDLVTALLLLFFLSWDAWMTFSPAGQAYRAHHHAKAAAFKAAARSGRTSVVVDGHTYTVPSSSSGGGGYSGGGGSSGGGGASGSW